MQWKRRMLALLWICLVVSPRIYGADHAEVLLVSQATANLSDFAQISAHINAQYARRHGYGLVVARGEADDWVGDRDVRWSKVAILQDLSKNERFWAGADWNADPRYEMLVVPTPHSSPGFSGRLLVFLDADAAVSNFDKTFEWSSLSRGCRTSSGERMAAMTDTSLLESLVVLMCKEGDGGSIANTGVIIARDVPATREFLSRWWAAGDSHPQTLYGMRHEQSALDRLISQDVEMSARIGIAAASAFNTAPPFYKTHTTSSFILHLMFEPYGGLRRKVLGELAACITSGHVDEEKKERVISRLPALAEDAYAQGMKGGQADEDLAVMYAQLLWSVHGADRGMDALDLYAKAVALAPSDPDTHRIFALATVEILGKHEGESAHGRGHKPGWCGVIASLRESLRLETNPTRIPQVKGLVDKAQRECARAHTPGSGDGAQSPASGRPEKLMQGHDDSGASVSMLGILASVIALTALIASPVVCSLLSARVKDKYD